MNAIQQIDAVLTLLVENRNKGFYGRDIMTTLNWELSDENMETMVSIIQQLQREKYITYEDNKDIGIAHVTYHGLFFHANGGYRGTLRQSLVHQRLIRLSFVISLSAFVIAAATFSFEIYKYLHTDSQASYKSIVKKRSCSK